MEVLFVSHKYPPSIGGMEKQSFELINGMRQLLKVHTLIYEGRGSRLRFFATLNKRIIGICQQHPGISIIHFNDGLIASFCLLHRGYKHLKRVVTLHGLDVVFPNAIFRNYFFPKFNNFHLIVTVSRATANACIKFGIASNKIIVINNGVDENIATGSEVAVAIDEIIRKHKIQLAGKKLLVAMGRPVKRKGFSWFIKNVLPLLKGNYILLMMGPFNNDVSFREKLLRSMPAVLKNQFELLLGYPTDEREIRNLLATSAVKDKVIHLGKLPFDEMITVLRHADAFVMPNIAVEGDMEGFGLVCLEASLCGALVYAADIDGIPDAIHNGKNGILIKPGDVGEWTTRLNSLLAGSTDNAISKKI